MKWIACLAVLGVVAAGCGGGSTSTTATTTGKDAAAAAAVPPAIRTKGTITVAADATYPPDEFVAPDGKTIIGADPELVNAIGQVLGLTVTVQNATFDTIIPGLLSGKFDVGASSFTDTKEREKQLDFVTYFTVSEGFYVPSASTLVFNGLDSLCGHTVAVESGTTEADDAQAQAKTCTSAGKPADVVSVFSDQNAANLAVSSGRADAGFSDYHVASYIVHQSNGQFKLSGPAFNPAPYGLAVPKNGLAPAVLAALKVLMANGTYSKILQKWSIQAGAITTPVINGATS